MTPSVDLRTSNVAAHYVLPCRCSNCGWTGKASLTKGYVRPVYSVRCPECGCNTVRVTTKAWPR